MLPRIWLIHLHDVDVAEFSGELKGQSDHCAGVFDAVAETVNDHAVLVFVHGYSTILMPACVALTAESVQSILPFGLFSQMSPMYT